MNKRFDNILILSDFDGTFAGKDTRIVERNIKAIRYFQSLGGKFTFCTGRLPSMMKKLYPDFVSTVNAPVIMCNGAIIFDAKNDTVIEEAFFDGIGGRKDVMEIINRFPEISLACYTDDGKYQAVNNADEIVGNKWRKVNLTFRSTEAAQSARIFINENYGDKYKAFRSSHNFCECVDKNVSKGKRIAYMKKYYAERGIDDLVVYAVGDYENDIDMLMKADKAFCPSNAIPEVKDICDGILCHHDEGAIADLIELITSHSFPKESNSALTGADEIAPN